jgi:uncharacterized surface protein with fasciclin (FAS1) repeats
LPPPPALGIISHLPGTFSTLELGLTKSGLIPALNKTDGKGLTLFAPTNYAFKSLGPRINAFLFSKFGAKFLKALLEYHIVPGKTLYSTAYNPPKDKETAAFFAADVQEPEGQHHGCHKKRSLKERANQWAERWWHKDDIEEERLRFKHVHIDLPTLLKNHSLAVDIFRRGPFVNIRVNAVVPVVVQDGLARDGVIHVVPRVLIPPKTPGKKSEVAEEDGEMTLEEFIQRLSPYVEKDDEIISEKDEKMEF